MVNEVILIGNLGDEVKMHYFENGNCVGNFPLATSRHYTNKQTGEKVEKTSWHNIVVSNKTAENCAKYLEKGKKVFIRGYIDYREYEKDGQKRYSTQIKALEVKFLSPSDGAPAQPRTETRVTGQASGASQQATNVQGDNGQAGPPHEEHDDLPF